MKQTLNDNIELRLVIEEIKKKTENNSEAERSSLHYCTKNIEVVFQYLDELLDKKDHPEKRNEIGYKV